MIKEPGVDIVTVQASMGHKNLNTTAIYTQPSQEDIEKAVDKLSK
jgi:integrase/recombinase XerC